MDEYPLNTLLEVRKLEESQHVSRLIQCANRLKSLEEELELLDAEHRRYLEILAEEDEKFNHLLSEGAFRIERIHAFEAFREKLVEAGNTVVAQKNKVQATIGETQREHDRLREQVEAAMARRKTVESHQDTWLEEQQRERMKTQERLMDDLTTGRFVRKRSEPE